MLNKIIIFFLVGLSYIELQAQAVSEFSKEPEKFLEELKAFMNQTNREDCANTIEKIITAYTEEQKINPEELAQIISISNIMVGRRMNAYPYFNDFLNTVLLFYDYSESGLKLSDWMKATEKILDQSKRGKNNDFNTLLDFANGMLLNNAMYTSQARVWKTSSNQFQFIYEGDPKVIIPSLDLIAYTNGDTIRIKNTRGVFYLLESKWIGNSGTVDWSRAGLKTDDAYCTFKKYTVDFNKSDYAIDSVTFYYKTFLDYPLQGSLNDKLIANNKPETSSYPRFNSYDDQIFIKNIVEKIDYSGGFSLQGSKTIGNGTSKNKAELNFYTSNGILALNAKSHQFTIDATDDISSGDAAIVIYMGKDSITHPGVTLRFKIGPRKLTLTRGNTSIGKRGFYNSHHQLEMYNEVIEWELDKPNMEFKMGTAASLTPAIFESTNYFDQIRFDKFQNLGDYNPISVIKKYCDDYGVRTVMATEVAKKFNPNYSVENIRGLLYKLVEDGFIDYDQEKELITVKEKTFKYVLANRNLIDYDVLKMVSNAKEGEANAILNLESYNMDIKGVSSVRVSDSKNVEITPQSGTLTLKENKDMEFSGSIGQTSVGRLEYFGEAFYFGYDSFKMDLKAIDSIRINIPHPVETDRYGNPKLVAVKSVVEHANGTLIIDAPNNKASKKEYPEYPSFESRGESYVYYDMPHIYKGVYNREKFYFKLDPFKFDSLDTFNPSTVNFPGSFTSSDIFPEFRETLRIQEDLSLGFQTIPPEYGYPIYDKRGRFKGEKISLSHAGLRGKGVITYLSSTSTSEDVVFFPDSLRATIGEFNLRRAKYDDAEVPSVMTDHVKILWEPYSDILLVEKKDGYFDFYGDKTKFYGSITLSPIGLSGKGKMDWEDALIISNYFKFSATAFDADSADLNIKAQGTQEIAFHSADVKAHIDLLRKTSKIEKGLLPTPSEFPYNQYITSISDFLWDIDSQTIVLEQKGPEEAYFLSTHPKQDSLKFTGKKAFYDLKAALLKVDNVPFIAVADAKIFPDSGKVTISPNAKINILTNSGILINTINEYHTIHNARVNITGKKKYSGSGYYNYVDVRKDTQQIFFPEIGVVKVGVDSIFDKKTDTLKYTIDVLESYAKAKIDKVMEFTLNPSIRYQGEVNIASKSKGLLFDGYAKIDTPHPWLLSDWFSIQDTVNPDTLLIYLNSPKNENRKDLFIGVHLPYQPDETQSMYTTFLNPKNSRDDYNVFVAPGHMKFDYQKSEFLFGNQEKFYAHEEDEHQIISGNYMIFNYISGKAFAEGKINLAIDLPLIEAEYAGNIKNNLVDTTYQFNLMTRIKFFFDQALLDLFAKDVDDLTFDLESVKYESADRQHAIAEFVSGKKPREKIADDIFKSGEFNLPEELLSNIFFTDLKLVWDPMYNTYHTYGKKLGIGFVGKKAIHKYIDGHVEFAQNEYGGSFSIYLELTSQDWYFFSYSGGILNILSSNSAFNSALELLPSKKREIKDKKTDQFFQYTLCTEYEKQVFLERIRAYK